MTGWVFKSMLRFYCRQAELGVEISLGDMVVGDLQIDKYDEKFPFTAVGESMPEDWTAEKHKRMFIALPDPNSYATAEDKYHWRYFAIAMQYYTEEDKQEFIDRYNDKYSDPPKGFNRYAVHNKYDSDHDDFIGYDFKGKKQSKSKKTKPKSGVRKRLDTIRANGLKKHNRLTKEMNALNKKDVPSSVIVHPPPVASMPVQLGGTTVETSPMMNTSRRLTYFSPMTSTSNTGSETATLSGGECTSNTDTPKGFKTTGVPLTQLTHSEEEDNNHIDTEMFSPPTKKRRVAPRTPDTYTYDDSSMNDVAYEESRAVKSNSPDY